jgi:hypothetical protein
VGDLLVRIAQSSTKASHRLKQATGFRMRRAFHRYSQARPLLRMGLRTTVSKKSSRLARRSIIIDQRRAKDKDPLKNDTSIIRVLGPRNWFSLQ